MDKRRPFADLLLSKWELKGAREPNRPPCAEAEALWTHGSSESPTPAFVFLVDLLVSLFPPPESSLLHLESICRFSPKNEDDCA